jgi:mannose-6-phosphate isomerase-like protein (cupin superfamily)
MCRQALSVSVSSSGGNKRGRRTDAGYDDRQPKPTEWANLGRTQQGRIPCRIVSEVSATATWTGSGKGEQLWFLGTLATIKVPGEASNGRFALIEFLFPRHASPPLHTHPQDESYIVQEGLLTVQAGEQRFELAPGRGGRCPDGGRAYLPRRQQHRACVCTEYAGRARTTGARRFGSGSEADASNERDTTTFS